MTSETYDYIIIGAGSAGCVLANRLSADPSKRVLVLEAGGRDDWIWFHIPVGYLFAIGNPRSDWMYRTEPVPGLDGRSLNYPRGKVIGGSSAINAMIYMRGQAADYDGWRQQGLEGWGWDDVLPLFLAQEDHIAPPSAHHRSGGEWRVEHPRMRWKVLDAFAEAAALEGIAPSPDFNGGDNAGSGYFNVNQRAGLRWSAARGFLKPVLSRPNLALRTGARVDRVILEGGRAVGVAWTEGGQTRQARCRGEVVLSAGAVNTPHLLELSGIGDGARLSALGLPTHRHLPGVGENLQDHLQIRPAYRVSGVPTLNALYASLWRRPLMALEYALLRRGPMSMAPSHMGAFARTSPHYATPNVQFHVQPLSLDRFGEPLHRFPAITISVCNLRPESRGSIHAGSPDPADAPLIQPNYLATAGDQQVAVESMRLVRRIVAQAPLARYAPDEMAPGLAVDDDAGLLSAARQLATTIFHPVGTARMGLADDPMAVVDARLRVIGVEGLRVADASVMPTIVSGNTNTPTLMIAEKAARMILEDAR
ncbi:MAG: GMC family oxidoreductase N-terminal domain-containing protein [Alphaproteobacteria bacterium]|nr:GMC family oxidoreductase N-terminal domain-containing protein [Alphaproteobacteria bacterium]